MSAAANAAGFQRLNRQPFADEESSLEHVAKRHAEPALSAPAAQPARPSGVRVVYRKSRRVRSLTPDS